MLPPLDSRARPPLLLAGLLLAALLWPLRAVDDVGDDDGDNPTAGLRGSVAADAGGDRVEPVIAPAPVAVAPVIAARSIFSPAPHPAAGAGADPLGGVTIAGAVRLGHARFAMLVGADGRVARLPLGGRIGAWTLTALHGDEAVLAGGAAIHVRFGARGALPASPAATGGQ